MQTHMATVVSGHLQLDEPLQLPDQSRVAVTVAVASTSGQQRLSALKSWWQHLDRHPIDSGGLRFTREELHERR